MKGKKRSRFLFAAILGMVLFGIFCSGKVVFAAGFTDTKIDASHIFSKYPLDHYQLDFYVDTSWDWLPWNWGEGIGDAAIYAVYMITNVIWYASVNISSATGTMIEEAFSLDFVGKMADTVGKGMQTLAGISKSGISKGGLYGGFLLLLILILGIYVLYVGLLKRETSRALNAVLSFVFVFVFSASFLAGAPDMVKKINGFSKDVAESVMKGGTKLIASGEEKTKSGEELMRENLFEIQVRKPWLLLQFGNTEVQKIGQKRVKAIESVSPDQEDGDTREDAVEEDIEDHDNKWLSPVKVAQRLGMVLFLLVFNLGISAFVFYLTGLMILSQVLFLMMALFTAFVCVLAMMPGQGQNAGKFVLRLFNILMLRSGITLIVCIAFCISAMFYGISGDSPFFLVMFLQVVTFGGIAMKLDEILGLFGLRFREGHMLSRGIQRGGRSIKRMERRIFRESRRKKQTQGVSSNAESRAHTSSKESAGMRMGRKLGSLRDVPERTQDFMRSMKGKAMDAPLHGKYAMYRAKEQVKGVGGEIKAGAQKEQKQRVRARSAKQKEYQERVVKKREDLQRQKRKRRAMDGIHPSMKHASEKVRRAKQSDDRFREKRVTKRRIYQADQSMKDAMKASKTSSQEGGKK